MFCIARLNRHFKINQLAYWTFQVKGFVTKMEECMGACDCIITKVTIFLFMNNFGLHNLYSYVASSQAGPGTIAEAMIRGLPIILNDYIAGQVCDFF